VVIKYDQKSIATATETKFLDLIIDDTLSWNQHSYFYLQHVMQLEI
jgi:hypothetical protein